MAKEIGNWGKLPTKRKARIAGRSASALELMASRVEPDEKILWAGFGSGERRDDRIWAGVGYSVVAAIVLAGVFTTLASHTTAGPQLGAIAWLLLGLPVYVGYCILLGPRAEVYAVTERRALVLRRNFPYLMHTFEILSLRVQEPVPPDTTGAVFFGRDLTIPAERTMIADWHYSTPEAGFYGIEDPVEVARLIRAHLVVEDEMPPDSPEPNNGEPDNGEPDLSVEPKEL